MITRLSDTEPAASWDLVYATGIPPVWDIGRPQSAFSRLADRGLLRGRVLDVGCGTGEHTLLAAELGAEATGVDISALAIEQARRKAAERGVSATFAVADALQLYRLEATYDVVLDSGTFHMFDDHNRARYVASLAAILEPGGLCHVLCQSDQQEQPLDRPRRVSRQELRTAFGPGWVVAEIAPAILELNPGSVTTGARAWLASALRTADRQDKDGGMT